MHLYPIPSCTAVLQLTDSELRRFVEAYSGCARSIHHDDLLHLTSISVSAPFTPPGALSLARAVSGVGGGVVVKV